MTILHLSDTHNKHRELAPLPAADVVVHSGDFSLAGTCEEAVDFLQWFCDLPHRHKIFIAGNHDNCLYGATLGGLDPNCHYLCHSAVTIEGIKFYGMPLFMQDAFAGKEEQIPTDTQVLITHQPPYGILDTSGGIPYGSEALLLRLVQLPNLQLHLFGHVHDAHGATTLQGIEFRNSALMDAHYRLYEPIYTITQIYPTDTK